MRQQKSLFLDSSPSKNSQYIFDDLYKNAANKKKFQNNPSFSYFNAIIKMKSKLSDENKQIYQSIFNPDIEFVSTKYPTSFGSKMDGFKTSSNFNFYKNKKDQEGENKGKEMGLTKVNFKFDHHKRPNNIYSQKPKLDDIMAEYRKLDKSARMNDTRSTNFSIRKNKMSQLQFLKGNKSFLPKCSPKKKKRTSSFL